MKYYSDITKRLYETREQLSKAERDYKMKLIAKARADEKARKIADLEAQLAELKGETTKANKPLASEKSNEDNTAPTKTNGSCKDCDKCVNADTEDKKKKELTDSGYYSSAYVNLNGKEFYSEGADSWNDVKKAVREYFEKLQGLK